MLLVHHEPNPILDPYSAYSEYTSNTIWNKNTI